MVLRPGLVDIAGAHRATDTEVERQLGDACPGLSPAGLEVEAPAVDHERRHEPQESGLRLVVGD